MHQGANQHGRDRCSIKYKWDPIEGATFELAELVQGECVPNLTEDHENGSCKISQSKSPKILTTHELISAVGHVLDCTSRSLSFLQKKDFNNKVKCSHQADILDNIEWGKGCSTYCLDKKRSLHPSAAYNFSSMVQPNLDYLGVIYGVSVLKTGNESYSQSLLRRFLGGGRSTSIETWEGKGLSSQGISYGLGNIYGWMSQLVPKGATGTANTTAVESEKVGHCFSGIADSCCNDYRSGERGPDNSVGQKSADLCPGLAQSRALASAANAKSEINRGDIGSLHSDYNLKNGRSLEADVSAPSTYSSRLHRDYYLNALAFRSTAYDQGSWSTGSNEMFKSREKKCDDLVAGKNSNIQICLPESARVKTTFAKQEHAFAGAFAGIFVSLCLHPVDTVKTIVQSCRAEEKSLCFIGRSIVSERGKR